MKTIFLLFLLSGILQAQSWWIYEEFYGGDNVSPQAPASIIATGREGAVDLSWTASTSGDVKKYLIYRSNNYTDDTDLILLDSVDVPTVAYVDTPLYVEMIDSADNRVIDETDFDWDTLGYHSIDTNTTEASASLEIINYGIYDDFSDGNYTGWTVASGEFAVNDDVPNPLSSNDFALVCNTAGIISIPCTQAYGTWEFDYYSDDEYDLDIFQAGFINSAVLGRSSSTASYWFLSSGLNAIFFDRNGDDLARTADNYVPDSIWYRARIERSALGVFTLSIKGGTFTDFTLIDPSVGGDNPVLDNTYTTSAYFVLDLDAGARISNIVLSDNWTGNTTTNYASLDDSNFTTLISGVNYTMTGNYFTPYLSGDTCTIDIGDADTSIAVSADSTWLNFEWEFTATSNTDNEPIKIYLNQADTILWNNFSLKESPIYYYSVKAKDHAGNTSAFGTADSGEIPNDLSSIINIKFPYDGEDAGEWLGYVTVVENYETAAETDPYANTGLAYDQENHLLIVAVLNDDSTLCNIRKCKRAVGNLVADLATTVVSETLVVSKGYYRLQGFTYDGLTTYMVNAQENVTGYWHVYVLDDSFDITDDLGSSLLGSLSYDHLNDLWVTKTDVSGRLRSFDDTGTVVTDVTIAGISVYGDFDEGVAIDPINGDIFYGGNDSVVQFDLNGTYIRKLANATNEAEGLVVDPSDQTLWFNIDFGYHGDSTNGNRCYHLNPNNTYNKFFTLGRMYTFSKCKLTQVTVTNGVASITTGEIEGIIISPVIKKDNYTVDIASIEIEGGHDYLFSYLYRGSNSAPSTDESGQYHALNIYDANGNSDGWGTTEPGAWQATVPDNDYIQVKVTVKI